MTRRMRLLVPPGPTPKAPSWVPAVASRPTWEQEAAERFQGAATALTRGIPHYIGPSRLRTKRNRQLEQRYGQERTA